MDLLSAPPPPAPGPSSSSSPSPVVCHVPDCLTTQAEIEAELKAFLSGYCAICKKGREGRLCGCAFPCSLTFRAQMMKEIHQLLGVDRPAERKAIQVRRTSSTGGGRTCSPMSRRI